VLAHIAERGSRYSRSQVREYQLWYNTNLSRIQSAFAALAADQGRPATEVTRDIEMLLGELVVDGLWGDQTAGRTSLFVAEAPPPGIAASVPAWWRVRSAAYSAKIDSLSALANASSPAVSADEPAAPVVPPGTPQGSVSRPLKAAAKTNYFAWLGIAAVLGVGGFLLYRNMKPGRSPGRSSKKARRLQAAAA